MNVTPLGLPLIPVSSFTIGSRYVEGRLGDRTIYADEALRDGFCDNLASSPLLPLKVVTSLEEATFDADIVVNSLPSTDTRSVFEKLGKLWSSRDDDEMPLIISLSKGVEFEMQPHPHVITPTRIIQQCTNINLQKLMYLGGPNIAKEVWAGEYATARLCGARKWRVPLAEFLRSPNFVVWDHPDVITHEVMGGLKNVYAIGNGIVSAATQDSATAKSVYFSNACAEMVFITHLLSPEPEYLAGPLLSDTYVTLLKGRNAWYGRQIGEGKLSASDGQQIQGVGTIQGVSAVKNFYALLSDERVLIPHPLTKEHVPPIKLLPTLEALNDILDTKDEPQEAARKFVQCMKDEAATDPSKGLYLGRITKDGTRFYNYSYTHPTEEPSPESE